MEILKAGPLEVLNGNLDSNLCDLSGFVREIIKGKAGLSPRHKDTKMKENELAISLSIGWSSSPVAALVSGAGSWRMDRLQNVTKSLQSP